MDEPRTPRRPKVLISTVSLGAGHESVALALREALARRAPGVEVETVHVMDEGCPIFRRIYVGCYELAMSALPKVYGALFRASDGPHRPGKTLLERAWDAMQRHGTEGFGQRVLQERPDLVLHTHFLAHPTTDHLRRTGQLDVPILTVVTDYLAHRFWYAEHVDRWFVPASRTGQRLRRWGYDDEQVVVSGLPVRPCWHDRQDPGAIREDLSLPADRPIVLLSGGVRFTCGPVAEIARLLVRKLDVHVVVLAGRNDRLLSALRELPETPGRITPLPFTDRVAELAEAASAMVTKGGGVTTSECVIKGLPLVLMPPVPGQEQSNAEYFRDRGAARIGRSRREIVEGVRTVLEDASARREMIARQRRLARRGAEAVAEAVCRALNVEDAPPQPPPRQADPVRVPSSPPPAIR